MLDMRARNMTEKRKVAKNTPKNIVFKRLLLFNFGAISVFFFFSFCWMSALTVSPGRPSVLLPPVSHHDTKMKDEMKIVTDAIMVLLIEGEAKLSPP